MDAIDDTSASVSVCFISNQTSIEGEERFQPTSGYESTTIAIVSRADAYSTNGLYDAIEILSSAQKVIYESATLVRTYNSIERESLTAAREPRSENMCYFAEQRYVFEYITEDKKPDIIK